MEDPPARFGYPGSLGFVIDAQGVEPEQHDENHNYAD
jgi:hypothetical protein